MVPILVYMFVYKVCSYGVGYLCKIFFSLLHFILCLHLSMLAVGLGFMTSITFIFFVGVFMSSWLGTSVLSLGEWFIKRMPFVRHIYNASKQISAAISPGVSSITVFQFHISTTMQIQFCPTFYNYSTSTDQNSQAFKEVAIIRHPRLGEYAFGFITSSVLLQVGTYIISWHETE